MIECPRCGFSQPEDRYCANCGLDIQNFKPQLPPWYRRLFRTAVFQITAATVLVVLFAWQILHDQTQNIENQISRLEKSISADVETITPVANTTPAADRKSPANAKAVHKASAPVQAEREDAVTEAQAAAPFPTVSPSALLQALPIATLPETVQISFYEVPREALAAALQDSQSLGISPAFQIFNLASVDRLKTLTSASRALPGSMNVNIKDRPSRKSYLVGGATAGSPSGLIVDMGIPVAGAAGTPGFSMRLAIQVSGSHRDNPSQVISAQMDEVLQTSTDHPVLILGAVPTQLAFPAVQPAELTGLPFHVLTSPSFQQSATDAVLILRFK